MQTLSEFYEQWKPSIVQQSRDVAAKIEAGQNMSRFLLLEPKLRGHVDTLVLGYSKSLTVAPDSLGSLELGYLFHLRLLQALEFAQFLDHCGFGPTEMAAREWIRFLGIDSWHGITRRKWRYEFSRVYGEPRSTEP